MQDPTLTSEPLANAINDHPGDTVEVDRTNADTADEFAPTSPDAEAYGDDAVLDTPLSIDDSGAISVYEVFGEDFPDELGGPAAADPSPESGDGQPVEPLLPATHSVTLVSPGTTVSELEVVLRE